MTPMQTKSQTPKLLQASWTEWTSVVRRFARYGVHTGEYNRQHYRQLHSRLQSCIDRALDEMSADAGVLQGMKLLSAPWPSVDSLASADKKLLNDLINRCNALQNSITYTPVAPRRRYAVTTLAMLLFLTAITLLLSREINHSFLEQRPGGPTHSITDFLRNQLSNANEWQQGLLILCVSAAVVMFTWLVFRPPGRY